MSFEKYYDESKIPEWKKLYINFKLLKNMLQPFETAVNYKPKLKYDVIFSI
jgi:SPX domain protein involved in polyphosphate accumulation